LTEPFLSAAVYRLFAEGQLDRDALICQYLEPCPKGWEQVTIRELLNHSSGIPDLSGEFLDRWKGSLGETYHAVVRSAEDLALQTEPGEVFRYSNGGYVLLARILEVVTGTPVNEAMNELVFRPMGLSGAGMEQSPDLEVAGWYNGSVEVQRLANGYNGSPEEVRTAYSPMYTIPGAGAAYGTVDDLDRFARELFEGSFLPKPLVEQLLTIDENLGVPYADGWVVRARAGQPTYRHDGGNNGFVSSLEYYPRQRMTVIVLSNFGFTDIGSIRKKLGLAALEKLGVDIEE
jgi:CubicO group peptidase (beta-lactamase class C family)